MRIIKTSSTQITPSQGQIVNARQESSVNTYSCNYVNNELEILKNSLIYDATDRIVGKWFDKDLHRFVYSFNWNSTQVGVPFATMFSGTSITSMNQISIVRFDIRSTSYSGNYSVHPYYQGDADKYRYYYQTSGNQFIFQSGGSWPVLPFNCSVIIEYVIK